MQPSPSVAQPSAAQPASRATTFALTALTMLAFAGNSLLCRYALRHCGMDPASFTALRILSGALMLWLLMRTRGLRASDRADVGTAHRGRIGGNWASAFALFVYAVAFSYAYVTLSAATGALLLFAAVQATMIGYGIARGESLRGQRLAGFALAALGLGALLQPGLSRPPLLGSLLMGLAGIAWGVYSLRGKGTLDPVAATAGNFVRAALPAAFIGLALLPHATIDPAGLTTALISGALTSGLGYVLWYAALRGLTATEGATVQLSVPVIAAAGGILLLGEPLTARLALCSIAILGGIALVLIRRQARSG